jgi:hypothetical protein
MKSIASTFLVGIILCSGCASTSAAAKAPTQKELSCTIGPLTKTYGKTQWLVYGCDDGRSVVVVTAPGSPAIPFYFFFAYGSKGMELHGEGTGNKQATDAAYEELKLLTETDIAILFQQAKGVRKVQDKAHAT